MPLFGGESRNRAVDDFLRWFTETSPRPLSQPALAEGLPQGVDSLGARYGTFGAKATLDGGPLDKNVDGTSATAQQPCLDTEAQPPPPCAATGECGDLLQLARRFQSKLREAEQAAKEAELALRASKVLNKRIERSFEHAARDLRVSGLSPDADLADRYDRIEKRILGPAEDNYVKGTFSVPRLQERVRSNRRMKMYLDRADSIEPLSQPHGRPGREVEVQDGIAPIIKELETELRQRDASPGTVVDPNPDGWLFKQFQHPETADFKQLQSSPHHLRDLGKMAMMKTQLAEVPHAAVAAPAVSQMLQLFFSSPAVGSETTHGCFLCGPASNRTAKRSQIS